MTSAPSKPTPQWKAVYDQLVEELPRHPYGSDYHTLAEVCGKFGVSNITARRVLSELAQAGCIEKRGSRPARVVRPHKTLTVYLLDADNYGPTFPTRHGNSRRYMAGIDSCAQARSIEVDAISESHLHKMFPRPAGEHVGFLVPNYLLPRSVEFLREHGLPYVLMDPQQRSRGLPYVRINRFHAGYASARHLLAHGHRRIAYVLGEVTKPNFRRRVAGYRAALKEAGIPFDWQLIQQTEGSQQQEARALDILLGLPEPPTAIITGDEKRAVELLDACEHRGLRVPADISLISYPNDAAAKLAHPPLTALDAGYERVGRTALTLLMDQMLKGADPATQHVAIKPKLIERASTGPPPRGAAD